jgi:hypothetical protein
MAGVKDSFGAGAVGGVDGARALGDALSPELGNRDNEYLRGPLERRLEAAGVGEVAATNPHAPRPDP